MNRDDPSIVGLQNEGFYQDLNGLPVSIATQVELRQLYQSGVSMWHLTSHWDLTEAMVRRILGMADWDRYGR
jgi:hypothetical protein